MRRFSSNSRKNQIYKAFREVGRVMRTVALLRFLADSGLRAWVTAATNKAEAYNGFSAWTPVRQPGRDRRERPGRAGKSVKWNSLLCNLIVFHTAIDMMEVIRKMVAEGWQVTAEDLAQLSPYLTSHILRFGAYATDELHIPPYVFAISYKSDSSRHANLGAPQSKGEPRGQGGHVQLGVGGRLHRGRE